MFRHLYYLTTVMLMYFIESIYIGFFIYLAWKYVINPIFDIDIIYFQWVFIVWVIKMLFYDSLKLPISNNNNDIQNTEDKNNFN